MAEEKKQTLETYISDPELAKIIQGLIEWHGGRIDMLNKIVDTEPSGAFELKDSDGNDVPLEGDTLVGLKAGLAIAIEVFSPFPMDLQPVFDDEEEEE